MSPHNQELHTIIRHISLWRYGNDFFDPTFIYAMRDILESGYDLTYKQEEAVLKIYTKFKIKEWYDSIGKTKKEILEGNFNKTFDYTKCSEYKPSICCDCPEALTCSIRIEALGLNFPEMETSPDSELEPVWE